MFEIQDIIAIYLYTTMQSVTDNGMSITIKTIQITTDNYPSDCQPNYPITNWSGYLQITFN